MIFNGHFLRRKPKFITDRFIDIPQYDPKSIRVWDLKKMVNIPPISMDQLTKRGVVENGSELIATAASVAQSASYALYQIPAVRKYFGSDYVHGFKVKTAIRDNVPMVLYQNLDDTIESIEYTKEITTIVEQALWNILEAKDLYIVFDGDNFFIAENDILTDRNAKDFHKDNRILWREE